MTSVREEQNGKTTAVIQVTCGGVPVVLRLETDYPVPLPPSV